MSADAAERPRSCPVYLLEPGDVIEVYVCIENDDYEWVQRLVVAVEDAEGGGTAVTYRVPVGWEGGGEYVRVYAKPGELERLAYVDAPLLWEGDDS